MFLFRNGTKLNTVHQNFWNGLGSMPTTTAKIIADSVHGNHRITTFECYYPRFILAEVNTHRMVARSSASSRAVPTWKRIREVFWDPFVPKAFGKNRPGMQASENISPVRAWFARQLWISAARLAAGTAWSIDRLGVHKQTANRLLEPFMYTHTVMTATEWANFFALRNHPEAQPEFQELAALMQELYDNSVPKPLAKGDWHTPYCDDDTLEPLERLLVSAARCARVSYKTQDGALSSLDKDRELAARLVSSRHLSPFDHQGQVIVGVPDVTWDDQRHFVGFQPFRVYVERQHSIACRNFYQPARSE